LEVGAADFAFLALSSAEDSPLAGPYLETCLGEVFRLEPDLEEGVLRVLGVGEELDLPGAFPATTAGVACSIEDISESRTGDPSSEQTISSTQGGACLEVLVFL